MRVITQDQDRKTLSAANIEDTAGDVDIRLKEDRHDGTSLSFIRPLLCPKSNLPLPATVVDHPSTTRSLADSVITLSDSDSGLEYFPDRDDLLEAPATLKRKEPPSRTVQPSGSSKRVKGDVVSDQLPAITVKHEHFDVDIKPERGPSKGYRRPTAGDPNRAWTPQQHYEVIKGIIDVASRAGSHWDVITQAVQAHSPPRVVRTQNVSGGFGATLQEPRRPESGFLFVQIIKKTWVTTEKPRLGETLSSQGRLFTLKDLPAQTRGSERAWNQAEKRSLWTGIVRAGSRMCDWVKITNEVNKAGAVPRTVDVSAEVLRTWRRLTGGTDEFVMCRLSSKSKRRSPKR
jgi:hypothetical protein